MDYLEIEKAVGRKIIDSRGNPTVEAEVHLAGGTAGRRAAPSRTSTGELEALELRDGDGDRFGGKGVGRVVQNVNATIRDTVRGMDAPDIYDVDQAMIKADGTEDKSELDANTTLTVSIAVARVASISLGISPYRFSGGMNGNEMPVLMMNILNGGTHAANTVDVQEFMIMPASVPSFRERLRQCMEMFHAPAALLKEKGLTISVGNEGGSVPDLASNEEAVQFILKAVRRASYGPGKDFMLAMGAAFSKWKSDTEDQHTLPKSKKHSSSGEPVAHWKELCKEHPIHSVEDGLSGEGWGGWQFMTRELGGEVQSVKDDLFAINIAKLKKGISMGYANSVLIRLNQIGSVLEALKAIRTARRAGYMAIASHRSGEAEDTTIADSTMVLNTCQIKTGAPSRSERVTKYSQLLRIEGELKDNTVYPGMEAFNRLNGGGGGR